MPAYAGNDDAALKICDAARDDSPVWARLIDALPVERRLDRCPGGDLLRRSP